MEEQQQAPYEAGLFPGSRIVLLAAHPDDEVLGAGGTLHLLAARGADVRIFVFSRGEAGGDPGARAEESRRAASILGLPEPSFGDFPDRGFRERLENLKERIAGILREGPWDVLFCPAPSEIHPDHRALACALLSLVQSLPIGDSALQGLWSARIAFYEISAPQKVDFLVDITAAAAVKEEAIRAFTSQNEKNDFPRRILGLNAYRSYTLPPEITHAEGFRVTGWQDTKTTPLTAWFAPDDPLFAPGPPVSIGVVVRTKNRYALLKEALDSLALNSLAPAQVVVVNDGREPLDNLKEAYPGLNLQILSTAGKGRAAAANAGLQALSTEYAAFLDDDDIVYPHHYAVLSRALSEGGGQAAYTDAVSAIYRVHPASGARELKEKLIAYSRDFDGDLLLYDNYIPFHTLAFSRRLALSAGPLREDLDVFEDWEFLIRMSRLAPFLHIRQATCEYRHFPMTQTLGEDPQSKAAFLRGRRKVLELTRAHRTPEVEERLFKALHDEERRLTGEKAVLDGEVQFLRQQSEELHREIQKFRQELGMVQEEARVSSSERTALQSRLAELEDALRTRDRAMKDLEDEHRTLAGHLESTYAEIHRLNGTLSLIYASKTWKVHQWVQRVKNLFKS
jgi:LmbE family N-acetylglucosaminyl deacetylase/glycosyltransferase involved in cell wall biosynthesis